MPRNPDKVRCSVPDCQAWAIHGSDPPRCAPHRDKSGSEVVPSVGAPAGNENHLIHGFYSTVLHGERLADLSDYAADRSMDAEIIIARLALRRILGILLTGTTPAPNPQPLNAQDYARFAALAFQGASTLSRLLRTRETFSEDPLQLAISQAIDELAEEWGINL